MERREPFLYSDFGGQMGAKDPSVGLSPGHTPPSLTEGRVVVLGGPAQLPGDCAWLPPRRDDSATIQEPMSQNKKHGAR